MTTLPTFEDIKAAYGRVSGKAHKTPVVTSRTLNEQVGAEVFLKCENLQRMGAFKFRGAYNTISQLSDSERTSGVITYSSGNHAQAVALVCQELGIKSTIVMPSNAPVTKLNATRGYGAEVVEYDPETGNRQQIAESLAEEHGYTLVPPFDHSHIVAGAGTASFELSEEVGPLDMLLTPCGGGGLLSGSAIAAKGFNPNCRVIGVEPVAGDDGKRSFESGTLQTVHNPDTIADGTRTPSLGPNVTFPLIRQYVDAMEVVDEEAIKEAVRFLFYRMKIVVEPSGVLGVAALLNGVVKPSGKVGVILSGGNIDAPTMSMILNEG